jgi:ribonucleoside-diphosphate reductase alpha chain
MQKERLNLSSSYSSSFEPSSAGMRILKEGRILASGETPRGMVERVVNALFDVEKEFGTSKVEADKKAVEFGELLDNKDCVMSTPVMTNAGRYVKKPLSACTIPPIDFKEGLENIKQIVDSYHEDGMGTGFNLDEVEDPISIIKFLNLVAIDGSRRGNEDRPVGNMAVISVNHPKINDFISLKVGADERGEEWKFNISINVTEGFMKAAASGEKFNLLNGELINASLILKNIAKAACSCGDPGLTFIDRMNRDNPTPIVGSYVGTAPCAEVGLAPGESCQFGYINLGNFVDHKSQTVNYKKIEHASRLMTRALDNALEISINNYSNPLNKSIMTAKRKIGVGVCGLADMLIKLGLPYDSDEGASISSEIMGYINYFSKVESIELAKQRGSFGAMKFDTGNRYLESPGFLSLKYGKLGTNLITGKDWKSLEEKIQATKLLRNASTTALPPTGRSGLVIDASTGIEPLFSLIDDFGSPNKHLVADLQQRNMYSEALMDAVRKSGKLSELLCVPVDLKNIYKTTLEINPEGHLRMVEKVQQVIDESISKTINIPSNSTSDEIYRIYLEAYDRNLKGITVFRVGSRASEPKMVA